MKVPLKFIYVVESGTYLLRLNNIPLYIYPTFLYHLSSMKTEVDFILWPVIVIIWGTMQQWTWECGRLFHTLISFPSDTHLEVILLNPMPVQFSLHFWRKLHTVLHIGCTRSHSHQQCTKFTLPSHPHWHLSIILLVIDILTHVSLWFLIVVFASYSLMISDVKHLSWIWWSFVYLHWKIAYSGPLAIF